MKLANLTMTAYLVFCNLSNEMNAEEKIQIKPSVWGTQSWVGGYEIYRNGKLDREIRPSVWGTEKWPGGYEIYKNGTKIGEINASVWGQDKWYGGYEIDSRTKGLYPLFK